MESKTKKDRLRELAESACREYQEERNKNIPTNIYLITENADVSSVDYTNIWMSKKDLSPDEIDLLKALADDLIRVIRKHSINLLRK